MLLELDDRAVTPVLAQRLAEVVPTVEGTKYLSSYNLSEWDVIICSGSIGHLSSKPQPRGRREVEEEMWEWGYYYPPGVAVLTIVPTQERQSTTDMVWLGFHPPVGKEQAGMPALAVVGQNGTVGSHLSLPSGLDPALERLVQRELVPAMRKRSFHRTFHRGGSADIHDELMVRPFLLGPDDEALAGSFDRDETTPVWFLPSDIPDLFPWVVAALREWHERFPERFPVVPDWAQAREWLNNDELALQAQRDDNESWIRERLAEFKQRDAQLDAQLEAARRHATLHERALLTADGDDLVDAVACALAELGFHVIDMDEHWPVGQRKEDLRVLDDDAPGWIALVEVKGFSSGVRETGFTALVRWGQFYVQDTKQLPDASWYIANGFRRDDPSTRPDPYAGRDDALDVVEEAGGVVIDTRALFDLLRITRTKPDTKAAARQLLRESTRRLTRCGPDDLG